MRAVALLAVLAGLPADAGAQQPLHDYVVRPGDTCWSIARSHYGHGRRYDRIHAHNELGPPPHLLQPGSVLELPGDGLSAPVATVEWVEGKVQARSSPRADWLDAAAGLRLLRGYELSTGPKARAGLAAVGEARLVVEPDTLLAFPGTKAKRRGPVRLGVRLARGAVRARLPAAGSEPLALGTPAGRVDLATTDSLVEVDAKGTTAVAAFAGTVTVRGKGAAVQITKGQGTAVRRRGRPEPARPLPAPPAWPPGAGDAVVPLLLEPTGRHRLRWEAVEGAVAYRVRLARDATATRPEVEALLDAEVRELETPDLAPGEWYARVATRAAPGLEGPPGPPIRLDVAPLNVSRRPVPGPGGAAEAAGLLRLELPDWVRARAEWAVDGGPLSAGETPIRLAEPGDHTVVVRARGSGETRELHVRLLDIEALLDTGATTLRAGGDAAELLFQAKDERGRPVAPPGLTAAAHPGGPLELEPLGPGVWRAGVRAAGDCPSDELVVTVSWAAGELARARFSVEGRTLPPPPPPPGPTEEVVPWRWPADPPAAEWARTVPGLPTRRTRPVTGFGLTSFVTGSKDPDGMRRTYLRSALRGERALAAGAWGLDADLPWYDAPLEDARSGANELGDLRLGARRLLPTPEALGEVEAAASLRLVAPTGGQAGADGRWLAEPGLLAEHETLPWLRLATNQVLTIGTGTGGFELGWTSSLAASTWPLPWLSLSAEAALTAGLLAAEGESAGLGLSGGLAARAHWNRLRLGLVGGGPMTPASVARVGAWSAGVGVDLAY